MCGVVGEFSFRRSVPVSYSDLEKMLQSVAHRGPDNQSVWFSEDKRVGLGHARLSITDLDVSANQPFLSGDNSVVIVFNGEIYNHLKLREELIKDGVRFKTDHSDTEVLVNGYQKWGIRKLLEKLNGMFAFALHDLKNDVSFLARDRVGIKPLYYIHNPSCSFLFASEIKALVNVQSKRDISVTAMQHYLSFIATPPPNTMFKGISKLPSGHYMTINGSDINLEQYWDLSINRNERNEQCDDTEFLHKEVYRLLSDSVDLRAVSDVKGGVLLSGGIDSSALCAIAKAKGYDFETFTVGFKDHTHLNEVNEARAFSESLGLNHNSILVDEADMKSYIEQLIYVQDEPIADWVCIPLHFVSQLAKDNGVKVLLVGEGADEQFFGYPSYGYYIQLQKYFFSYFKHLPQLMKKLIYNLANSAVGSNSRYLSRLDILRRGLHGEEAFWGGATVFWDQQKQNLFNSFDDFQRLVSEEKALGLRSRSVHSDSALLIKELTEHYKKSNSEYDYFQIMAYLEFCIRLPELLLMRVDKITMSHSIEARVPFLDHRLVEFTQSLPLKSRFSGIGHKGLLKTALQNVLPGEILSRPKRGFGAPMSQWLKGSFGDSIKQQVLGSMIIERFGFNRNFINNLFETHKSGKVDYASHIWSLYNLSAWYDKWID